MYKTVIHKKDATTSVLMNTHTHSKTHTLRHRDMSADTQ